MPSEELKAVLLEIERERKSFHAKKGEVDRLAASIKELEAKVAEREKAVIEREAALEAKGKELEKRLGDIEAKEAKGKELERVLRKKTDELVKRESDLKEQEARVASVEQELLSHARELLHTVKGGDGGQAIPPAVEVEPEPETRPAAPEQPPSPPPAATPPPREKPKPFIRPAAHAPAPAPEQPPSPPPAATPAPREKPKPVLRPAARTPVAKPDPEPEPQPEPAPAAPEHDPTVYKELSDLITQMQTIGASFESEGKDTSKLNDHLTVAQSSLDAGRYEEAQAALREATLFAESVSAQNTDVEKHGIKKAKADLLQCPSCANFIEDSWADCQYCGAKLKPDGDEKKAKKALDVIASVESLITSLENQGMSLDSARELLAEAGRHVEMGAHEEAIRIAARAEAEARRAAEGA